MLDVKVLHLVCLAGAAHLGDVTACSMAGSCKPQVFLGSTPERPGLSGRPAACPSQSQSARR